MQNKQANDVLNRDYEILCKKLLQIINYSFKLKYIQEYDETKRVFLNSPQGLLLKEGAICCIIINRAKALMPKLKTPVPVYEVNIDFISREEAKEAIKLIEAIAEFMREEFDVTISADRPQAGDRVVLTFF